MSNFSENLKTQLEINLNTRKMLQDTLDELYLKAKDNQGFGHTIHQLESEIASCNKVINKLMEEIRINSPKESETKQSFYDKIKKNDEVDKNKKLNYKELYEEDIKSNKAIKKSEIHSNYDAATQANRFLVRFEGRTNVPEHFVRVVRFTSPLRTKKLYIELFDFLTENNRPIITEITNDGIPFRIAIAHLDPTGAVLYTERYHGCQVVDFKQGDLAYNINDKWTIELEIDYTDVTYETSH